MDDLGPGNYGDAFADVYDDWYAQVTDTAACVERLAAWAGAGPVLELGVGTGRLALPLAARGLDVVGVDASAAMLDRLRANATAPSAGRATVTPVLGDMADLDGLGEAASATTGPFSLVVIAYNTLFNLPDEAAEAACLAGAGTRLAAHGALVVEAYVPADDAGPDRVAVSRLEADEVVLTATRHDPGEQVVDGQHIQITEAGIRLRPWRLHYLRPAQLDALAERAGFTLHERCADWHGAPFAPDSATHVSRYGRAPAAAGQSLT